MSTSSAPVTAYSSQSLISVVTSGLVSKLRGLMNLNPPQEDLNRALMAAAAFGKEMCVAELLTVADPKFNHSQAFRAAVRNNNMSCVELLIPVSDVAACNSEALRIAASQGFYHYLTMFMPMASAEECTQAFVEAVKAKHDACADLLAPYLHQGELLKNISRFDSASDLVAVLHARMAEHQHTTLQRELCGQSNSRHVSRKM